MASYTVTDNPFGTNEVRPVKIDLGKQADNLQIGESAAFDRRGDFGKGNETGSLGDTANDPEFKKGEEVNCFCFAAGTLIKTGNGERRVEKLACGDYVLTLDNGYQPIRWIGGRSVTAAERAENPKLHPIRIRAGALSSQLPETDLIVSRQHRVLIRSDIANRIFGCQEVLVPAVRLLALDGIEVADDIKDVSYWHMLFERHEVIWSNGAPTESLFTGPEALKSVDPEAREEILTLFPQLANPDFQPAAARAIPTTGKLAAQLADRHQKNNKLLISLD